MASTVGEEEVPILSSTLEGNQEWVPPQAKRRRKSWHGARAFGVVTAAAVLLGYVALRRRPYAAQQEDGHGYLRAQEQDSESVHVVDFGGEAFASEPRRCWTVRGVKLAETQPTHIWRACSGKWSENCADSGCCQDSGMQCYEKNDAWAACKDSCDVVDNLNESWTCRQIPAPEPHTDAQCQERCRQLGTCALAIFDSSAGGMCTVSSQPHHEVVWAADNFNSHICAENSSAAEMEALVGKIRQQLPFTNAHIEIQNCSWAGEDCSNTKCCNDLACDVNFENCQAYTCFRKSPYFSGCRLDAPNSSWDGTPLGSGRTIRSIPPAGSQVALQGTSLYCFSVVNWKAPAPQPFWSTEAELAENIKKNGVGIMQCDGHDWFDGVPTPKAAWGSFSNIDAFLEIWRNVGDKGTWRKHDYTVKVDADAVFFPARLKQHIEKLHVPRHSRVYFENIDYRFNFMGALEVLSNGAVALYLARSHECVRGKHEGGEDFFMKRCMDAIGIDHMVDHELLHDRYAAQDNPCTDGWITAYHFHKKVISWNWCYNEAVCGTRAKTCDGGIEVPFVMPWTPPPTTTTTALQ